MLEAHPRLTKEAIFAAFAFAADTLRSDIIYPITDKIVGRLRHDGHSVIYIAEESPGITWRLFSRLSRAVAHRDLSRLPAAHLTPSVGPPCVPPTWNGCTCWSALYS